MVIHYLYSIKSKGIFVSIPDNKNCRQGNCQQQYLSKRRRFITRLVPPFLPINVSRMERGQLPSELKQIN